MQTELDNVGDSYETMFNNKLSKKQNEIDLLSDKN